MATQPQPSLGQNFLEGLISGLDVLGYSLMSPDERQTIQERKSRERMEQARRLDEIEQRRIQQEQFNQQQAQAQADFELRRRRFQEVELPGVQRASQNQSIDLARLIQAENKPIGVSPGETLVTPKGQTLFTSPPRKTTENLSFEESQFEDLLAAEQQKLGRDLDNTERATLRQKIASSFRTDPAMAELRRSMYEANVANAESQKRNRLAQLENQYRDDYMKAISDDLPRATAYSNLKNANTTGAGDILLIYNFIKMMDPNAVREGEIALAEGAGRSIPQRFMRLWEQASKGVIFSKSQRDELISQADTLYEKSVYPRVSAITENVRSIAEREGMSFDNITGLTRNTFRKPKGATPEADAVLKKLQGR